MKSKCKGCERRKKILYRAYWTVVDPIQRFLRTLSGSQRYIKHHKQILRNIILNGAQLEHMFASTEMYTSKWLERLETRVSELEGREKELSARVEALERAASRRQ